jgi:hypothetical protein
MMTLRTLKFLTGPDLGVAALTFRARHEVQYGEQSWNDLIRIPREEWMRYLIWFRATLEEPQGCKAAFGEEGLRHGGARPDHHQATVDQVRSGGGIFASFIELLATGVAPEPPVTPGGPLRPLRNLLRAARDAPHFPIPHPGRSYVSRVSTSQSVLARRMTEPQFQRGPSCCATAMPPNTASDSAPIKANAEILTLMSNMLSPDIPRMTGSSGHLAGRLPAIQRHLQRRQCRGRIALTSCFQGAVKSAPPSWSSRPIHGVAPAFSAGVRADFCKEVGRSKLGKGCTPTSAFKQSFPPNDRFRWARSRPFL